MRFVSATPLDQQTSERTLRQREANKGAARSILIKKEERIAKHDLTQWLMQSLDCGHPSH